MSYDPNLPNPNDLLSNSQGQIKQNFQQLDLVYGLNHYEYSNATSNKGKHKQVEMPILNPPPTTIANEGTIYVTDQAPGASSNPLAVFRQQNKTGVYTNGTKDIPFVSLSIISMGVFDGTGAALSGSAYNNGGCTRNSLGVFTVSGLPAATANYVLLISPQYTPSGTSDNLVTFRINTKSATDFQVVFTLRSGGSNQLIDPTSFSYVAFGGFF